MKRAITQLACACAALVWSAAPYAANTDPFDFDYEIIGGIAERPALIFNDGAKTYIQPRAGQVITADGGHNEGPYVVIDGTPQSIGYKVGGRAATAHWRKANPFIGGTGALAALRDDQPAGFDGFTNRLVLIGTHGSLEPVRPLHASMAVANVVKALVPQGWTGTAQKDVDLTGAAAFDTRDGENWMQALDRLMTQTGLYADVDFDARHVRLLRDAPKSAALNYAASARTADEGGLNAVVARVSAPAPAVSQLAEQFGAQAIRDGDDTHTQIRFAARPGKDVTFLTPDGKSLHPGWDGAANVMTIDRAERFVVADATHRVEVMREAKTVYEFDVPNRAHLEAVFDRDGQTYFKFGESAVMINVTDARHLGSGEQKGRYYKFDGTADQFIASADGNTVTVTRRHDVTYREETSAAAATTAQSSRGGAS
ncbi:TrbG/VirB9 family P-type conjugative transfer protein [Burkholderia vietnamiensis]|uniref:TrbG/VirB9 family P-type conjugative transfer protein n=1 Tax=Burkholderia vietnamiensis TaxID=60552 RepID=UPI0026535DA7|nr:TrbG/VirB9 family P-type conjugative transfer protein [Burkholderia vietnamiensis]MDN8035797.1 TrbG/VirB9 family P-type conjugative transfer protein [Burkholderia vietnamiensis]